MTIKENTWYIHYILEAAGNNIRTSFPFNLKFLLVFDISIMIYFI